MDYKEIRSDEYQGLSELSATVVGLNTKCDNIVENLIKVFDGPTFLGRHALSITSAAGEREIALIQAPIGNGRIVRSFQATKEFLVAVLTVERQCFDKFDRPFWEPVWGIYVPPYGNAYSGQGENKLSIPTENYFTQELHRSLFSAGVAIVYAITNGLQADTSTAI